MTALEVILIIAGVILVAGSFMLTEKFNATGEQLKAAIDEKELNDLIRTQVENMEDDIKDMVEETAQNALEASKREMEKLSNEKIMAVDDFSKTVMEDIEKSHSEVLFLYGMLNDKNKEIKDTAELITKANKSINKKIEEANLAVTRLDELLLEIKQLIESQKDISEKMENSASVIENLEEQLEAIENMALQFSNDLESAKEEYQEKMQREEKNTNITEQENDETESFLDDEWEMTDASEEPDMENEEKAQEESEEENSDEISTEDYSELLNPQEEEELNKLIEVQDDVELGNNNEKILELSKEGMSTLEIAKQLSLGVGEVQLVIDLFEGGRSNEA